jgi:hypothetical protein
MFAILGFVALALVAMIAVVLLLAARKPDQFRYARSRTIGAPINHVFPEIAELPRMNRWNPYVLRETAGTMRYSGPDSGAGARFEFAGPKSGTGYVELVDAQAPERVEMRLVMTKPMVCDNKVDFTLEPRGEETLVTWAMSGRANLMSKIFGMIVDCDKMIAKDFDDGLNNLASIVEGRAAPALAAE